MNIGLKSPFVHEICRTQTHSYTLRTFFIIVLLGRKDYKLLIKTESYPNYILSPHSSCDIRIDSGHWTDCTVLARLNNDTHPGIVLPIYHLHKLEIYNIQMGTWQQRPIWLKTCQQKHWLFREESSGKKGLFHRTLHPMPGSFIRKRECVQYSPVNEIETGPENHK